MTERLEKELALRPTIEKIMATYTTSPTRLEFAAMSLKDALTFLGPDWSIVDSRTRIVKPPREPFTPVVSMPIHKALPIIGIDEEFILFQREQFMKAARSFLDRVKTDELRTAMDAAWKGARLRTSPFPTSGSVMFDSTPRGAEEIYRESLRRAEERLAMEAMTGIKVSSSDESAMMKKPPADKPILIKNVRLSWPKFPDPKADAAQTSLREILARNDEMKKRLDNVKLDIETLMPKVLFTMPCVTVAPKAPPEIEMDYETRLHRRIQKLEGTLERLSAAFTALNIGQRLTSTEATMAHVYPAVFPERCVEPEPEPVELPNNPLTDYGTPDVTNDVVSASVRTMSLHEEAPAVAMPNNYPAAGMVVRVYTDVENEPKAIDGWYAMSQSTHKWGMFDATGWPIPITTNSRWQSVQGCADLNSFYKA